MFQAKSAHLGHGLTLWAFLLLSWVQSEVSELLSKVQNVGAIGASVNTEYPQALATLEVCNTNGQVS